MSNWYLALWAFFFMEKNIMKCKKCGNEIKQANSRARYCNECRWISCETCGKKKELTTQQIMVPNWGRFCSNGCWAISCGCKHIKNGYWCVKSNGHPRAYDKDYYYEHILVAEKKIGRLLDTSTEVVHHKDGNRLNNDPDNLEVQTRQKHSKRHWPVVSTSEEVGIDHGSFSSVRRPKDILEIRGILYEFDPENPMSSKKGYVSVGRKIMSLHLGRTIEKNESVKHINGDKKDNRIENLIIVKHKYTERKCNTIYRNGKQKGYKIDQGYALIWNPQHPMAGKSGYVVEHRIIMAEYLGRMLEKNEHVHHKDGNRLNNCIENLEIISPGDHPLRHVKKC